MSDTLDHLEQQCAKYAQMLRNDEHVASGKTRFAGPAGDVIFNYLALALDANEPEDALLHLAAAFDATPEDLVSYYYQRR